jgi:molybdopterin-containing oxidoreductase family membrane subunit
MLLLLGVATFWKMISFYTGGVEDARLAADILISGQLATNFWAFEITIGIILPLLLLVVTKLKSATIMAVAGILTLIGMFVARLNMVIAGQLVPHYPGFDGYQELLTYTPSRAEWIVVFAGIGLTCLAFMIGERFFGKSFTEHGAH